MNRNRSESPKSIPADEYSREYYESCCQGYSEFLNSHGDILPMRLSIPLEISNIQRGMNIVDIGCGRGELVINCARLGAKIWGLDFSKEALLIANEIINDDKLKEVKKFMAIQRSNALYMPFANESIDIVFMLDIVEHLNPEELNHTFSEVWRVLKYDGRVIIHTMPNLWYYRYGYPLYRFSQNILGKHLPSDPRERWKYSHVHVNEQDPHKLRKCMELCTFDARVWLKPTQNYQDEASWFIRLMMQFLSRTYPFRFVFCNDIFGVGTKRCV